MKKLIDIKIEDVQPLKILAVKANKDLKNYIQDVLSEHVLKAKKIIMEYNNVIRNIQKIKPQKNPTTNKGCRV